MDFHGAKAILSHRGQVVLLRRDEIAHIPWPGCADLPGGGADPGESPEDCALREIREETGLALEPGRFHWRGFFPGPGGDRPGAWLFAGRIDATEAAGLRLGSEGSALWLEPFCHYIGRRDAVPHHQARVALYLRDSEAEERTVCRTPTPGRTGTVRLPTWKFALVRKAMLALLRGAGDDGIAFCGIADLLRGGMTAAELAALGSLSWHATVVKLELEVRGEIARVPGATPQRLVAV